MAAEKQTFKTLQSLLPLFVTLVFGAGWFVKLRTPQTDRPAEIATPPVSEVDPRARDARLWQDPFSVVTSERATKSAASKEPAAATELLPVKEREGVLAGVDFGKKLRTAERTLVLPVVVPGGPWERDREERRRARHAVCDALGRRQFVPDDPNHLRWVDWHPSELGSSMPAIPVPFEWYSHVERAHGSVPQTTRVLVAWLRESDLAAIRTDGVGDLLRLFAGGASSELLEKMTGVVVGPRSSEGLLRVTRELDGKLDRKFDPQQFGFEALVSPTATAAYADLGIEEHSPDGSFRALLVRATADDSLLAKAMADELDELRGFDPGDDELVLITEVDSIYTRVLRDQLIDALYGSPDHRDPKAFAKLRCCTFLRGLEGNRADGAKSDLGDSQVDYVTRFAAQLGRDRAGSTASPRAIGILAGDIFDKLLLLRALRPRFPGTIFFTFDLDAKFLDRDELPYTRNLLVASHFGLDDARVESRHDQPGNADPQANARDQPRERDAPVANVETGIDALSRGANQTAIRTAIEQIVDVVFAPPTTPDTGRKSVAERLHARLDRDAVGASAIASAPRVFEVGLGGVVDLGAPPPRGTLGECVLLAALAFAVLVFSRVWMRVRSGYRVATPELEERRMTLVGRIGALSVARRAWTRQLNRDLFNRHSAGFLPSWVFVIVAAAFAVAMVFALVSRSGGAFYREEPWSLIDGVSVWPTAFILFVAALLAAGFLRHVRVELAAGRKQVEQTVGTLLDRAGGTATAGPVGMLLEIAVDRYGRRAAPQATRRRMVLWILCFGGLLATFFLTLEMPHRPTRGWVAFDVLWTAILASIIVMHFLLVAVCDGAFEGARLLRAVAAALGKMPAPSGAGLIHEHSRQRVELEVMASAERVVGQLERMVYLPFIVLALMVVARSRMFDSFDWPPSLICTYACDAITALISGSALRQAAAELRQTIAGSLRRRAQFVSVLREPDVDDLDDRLWRASQRRECESAETAAETPLFSWARNPAMFAQLLPFGGFGAINLIEMLAGVQ